MGSLAAGRCIFEKSKVSPGRSSSTESKVVASSSPVNRSLKGKNKMHEQDEVIINSPTHHGEVELDSAKYHSDSGNITRTEDVNIDQDSGKIQKSSKPQKDWAKKIQQEWRILEKDLPDTIFVRVYESRMDLLRAVMIGAEGTPYHDGLFFFDVYFPYKYPAVPPKVYYRSGGLRINPNINEEGKVCLSLLNTWSGHKNEKWTPGVSTMLQVLVSIQGLVLNAKPYFNEQLFTYSSGSAKGEYHSTLYNERALINSLKTMVYTMKKPPKHFEDLVIGHFHNRAVTILTICRGYNRGVQVGCGVNGVEEKGSLGFRKNVARYMWTLIGTLQDIGVNNLDRFVPEIVPEIIPQTRSLGQKIKAFFCIKR